MVRRNQPPSATSVNSRPVTALSRDILNWRAGRQKIEPRETGPLVSAGWPCLKQICLADDSLVHWQCHRMQDLERLDGRIEGPQEGLDVGLGLDDPYNALEGLRGPLGLHDPLVPSLSSISICRVSASCLSSKNASGSLAVKEEVHEAPIRAVARVVSSRL